MRLYLEAAHETIDWWEAQRKERPYLPPAEVHRKADMLYFVPPVVNGYFIAALRYRRRSLLGIAMERLSRRWRSAFNSVREIQG